MPVRYLFADMNSFFASVEQQERPELRGRPIAVVPMLVDSTCCIAASYEAKLYGIKTGTGVAEARVLCPHIEIVEARPPLYVEYSNAIAEAVEDCIPVTERMSVDELYCRLWQNECKLPDALRMGERLKFRVKKNVGEWLTCSVGLAGNPLMAKIAANLFKPNGLSVINDIDIPLKLQKMKLTDWTGISTGMERRFNKIGVTTTLEMYQLTERQMKEIYGGIVGERWYHQIRNEDVYLPPTTRRQIGHSCVIEPSLRTRQKTRALAARLLEKAAERMRSLEYHCRGLSVFVNGLDGTSWERRKRFAATRDTIPLLSVLDALWGDSAEHPVVKPIQVGVVLTDIIPDHDVTLDLFDQEEMRRLTDEIDRLNRRFGRGTVITAQVLPVNTAAPDRIPFRAAAIEFKGFGRGRDNPIGRVPKA